MKSTIALSAALCLILTGVAWAGAIVVVDQKKMKFAVAQITIKKGDVINFTNSDDTAHNITISGPGVAINSGLQQPGVAFKAPFMSAGSYQVLCGIHPRMSMTVVVD